MREEKSTQKLLETVCEDFILCRVVQYCSFGEVIRGEVE